MSRIIKRFAGPAPDDRVEYEVATAVQDGVERSTHPTWEEALAAYRLGEKYARGFPPPDDPDPLGLRIPPPVPVDRTAWPVLVAGRDGMISVPEDALRQALGLACRALPGRRPGLRYRLRLVLEPLEEPPPFLGEGI